MPEKPLLPPHQHLVAPGKWPFVGESCADPARRDEPWQLTVSGLVVHQQTWSLEELRALPQRETRLDIHCVTRWSKLGAHFGGVLLQTLLDTCQPLASARFVSFIARSTRRHSTSLSLEDALSLETLLALSYEDQPLEAAHGGPLRTVVRDRYFYKSVKWLEEIRLLAEDELGYWEKEAGYHNQADPWLEQRYIVPNIDTQRYRRVLKERDFSHRDLLGIRADGRNLTGLNARRAVLRDAHFEGSQLNGACFDGANLSNAHFQGARLRGASFRPDNGQPADLEGADFRGADLRGADLTGASLFGASFCPERSDGNEPWQPALLDQTTRIEPEGLERLPSLQQEFVRRILGEVPTKTT